MLEKRGQVTIFIIIAIVLVVGIVVFFIFREGLVTKAIPASIEPVYVSFLSCLEDNALTGISVLESQGGYISLPDFELGSSYMPFSSQLNFLGNPIPYWYYVSGNNIPNEQVPSKKDMQNELADFIDNKISECVLNEYYEQGFVIIQDVPDSNIVIRDNEVEVNLNMNLDISKEEDNFLIRNHKVVVKSNLGKLYNSAKKIYDYEQKSLFLENYAIDTLRLYAPVDGVELTCSPMVWNAEDVFDELQEAIEMNTLSLKTKGGDYSLRSEENKYFVVDISIDEDVRFLNSKNWANSFEVAPSEGNVLISTPVGNQPGLGILGFCYVPYHFVYNVNYPVLIQLFSGDEIFQFPVAVIVQSNQPRKSLDATANIIESPQLCEYKNIFVNVRTYDSSLNPIDSDISYECFGEVCPIGKTIGGRLEEEFPQCVNGYIVARADGFEEGKKMYSTITSTSAEIILNRLYKMNIELNLDGSDYLGNALINFISEGGSKTIAYPQQKSVELIEGQYEIQVYIYKDSSLRLDATTYEQCMEIPQSGIGGVFGFTKEKCFDVDIPSQIISNALAGGGKENYYILESELSGLNTIEINAESLPTPDSIEDLQSNYLLFEDKELDILFK